MKKILTTITILFINFILIFSTLVYAENEENNKNEVKIGDTTYLKIDDAYADILKKTKESNSNEEITYATTDINNDNTPELIVCVGNNEAEKELFFYTYQSNKVVYLGKLSGGHTNLYEMNGKSYIMAVYGHMNNEIVYNISIENSQIKETKISEKTISDGEEYTKGDKLIEFRSVENNTTNESNVKEVKIGDTTYLKIDDAYADILKKTKESNSNEEITYATTDINNDNTPELIVCVGNNEAEKELFFYTYQSNKVVYLGKLSGGHTSLYEMNGKSYILAVYGQMKDEIVYNISIESKKIKETKISDKTISDGEEYTKGDKLIEFKDYKTTNNQDNKQSNEQQNESKQEENKIDTTTKSGKLPQTGENTIYVILSVIALIAINILLLIKNKKIK